LAELSHSLSQIKAKDLLPNVEEPEVSIKLFMFSDLKYVFKELYLYTFSSLIFSCIRGG